MKRFEGKTALITGAARGIGRATAQRLSSEGASVACLDLNAEGLAETVAGLDGPAKAFPCDISDPAQVAAAVGGAVEAFGGLDVLCNIAGVLYTANTHEMTLEAWNRVMSINLTGTFLMCREAIPHLLKTRGNIVNMSSTAALGGHPWMSAYAASKGAILSMTRSLSVEYVKKGLRVNAIVPGGIATDMHNDFAIPEGGDPMLIQRIVPHVKYVGPEYVASAIAFVASDDGKYMNGADLRVDGGMLS